MSIARIPFTPADESAIRQLSRAMLILLIMQIAIGGLGCVGGIVSLLGVWFIASAAFQGGVGVGDALSGVGAAVFPALMAACLVGQGALLLPVRRSLTAVVATDTHDQQHLADAFAKLRLFFALEVLIAVFGVFTSALLAVQSIFMRTVPGFAGVF
jgi:hypothetical protein